jgi:hypothetical protein
MIRQVALCIPSRIRNAKRDTVMMARKATLLTHTANYLKPLQADIFVIAEDRHA